MSYILEALKKSQQERELGQVPTLEFGGPFVEDREPQVTHHWALLAVGLAVLAVVIALYAAFRGMSPVPMTMPDRPKADPAPRLEPLTIQPSPPVIETPGVDPVASPLVEPPPPKPRPSRPNRPESGIDPVVRAQPPNRTADSDVASDWERTLWRQLEAEQAAINAAREIPMEPSRTAPIPEDLVQEIEAFKQQVRREQGLSPPMAQGAPLKLPEDPTRLRLTTQQQAEVPAYLMTVHVYDPDAAKRFVVINALPYREGEETREGLRVEQILKDGVVLSYLGNPFYVSR
ncbi:MAG: general secretion pathway protein GspB [Thermochromatium sp.]